MYMYIYIYIYISFKYKIFCISVLENYEKIPEDC